MISPYQHPRNLRISTVKEMAIPGLIFFRTSVPHRAFCFVAPELWNGLPPDVTDTNVSMTVFRSRLKTQYFRGIFRGTIDDRLAPTILLAFELFETDGEKHKFVYISTYILTYIPLDRSAGHSMFTHLGQLMRPTLIGQLVSQST